MDFQQLQAMVHALRVRKGWWEPPERSTYDLLLHIMTEVGEVYQELRHGHAMTEIYYKEDARGELKPEGVPIELGDIVQLVMDLAEHYQINLVDAILQKHAYNCERRSRQERLAAT